MDNKRFVITATLGCGLLIILVAAAMALLLAPFRWLPTARIEVEARSEPASRQVQTINERQVAIPTLTPALHLAAEAPDVIHSAEAGPASVRALYERLNPGVVNIQVYVEQQGLSAQGAGSGFILDNEGHIITNNHVVADADQITVIFYNQEEVRAEVLGTDVDSDLAVLQVETLPAEAEALALGDSDQVAVGEWVIAIGNPFGQQSSLSVGVVSAVGRTIPARGTSFSIAEAIQTDAAINPGNSGGPLLNLRGEVIGVNAQIATGQTGTSSGVGFAIPVNIARRVAPVLIESGAYQWPWLGVQGGGVNLAIMQANQLETQQGAYIDGVVSNSPAAQAGLEGTTGTESVNGLEVPVGGDVVVAAGGEPVSDFDDLLDQIAEQQPGDDLDLTVLRDGRRQTITVQLALRPSGFDAN